MTKTGDDGKSRWSGKEVEKDCELLSAVGDLDELQAQLGVAKLKNIMVAAPLTDIQKDLWNLMGWLAYEKVWSEIEKRIKWLEDEIIEMESALPKINEFVIPGVNETEAEINLARTVCRRAERSLVRLDKKQKFDKNILIYINRLSDYLFMLGRIT